MDVLKSGSLLTADDLFLFNEGTHYRLHEKMGSHLVTVGGVSGTQFAVWAPSARSVAVVGDFNAWDGSRHPMTARGQSGIWETFIPDVGRGEIYKYQVISADGSYRMDKADPFALHCETPPRTGSVVWDLEHAWGDADWMASRGAHNAASAPWAVYEVHIGSWMRVLEDANRSLSYVELAPLLAAYVQRNNFTHVEFMPVMEHPFFGSWGYQVTGYFAPSSRMGTPQDFMHLVDALHQAGIGVILDWVPSHFPNDDHGLGFFDGTHLFEHADPKRGFHPDWKSYIFNFGRHEVRSFLISNAIYWLDRYHADGLRVDAVASMLYLDYSRRPGEWIPNQFGGRENLEAIDLLRRFNTEAYAFSPDIQTIAEESTAWPMVSRPTYVGGLGFGMKWDMGWMHDTLDFFSRDPIHRRYHHSKLTFRTMYAFTENFMLPLSHDEVVHGKGSLIRKMPGDEWQRFANLRLLFGYMYGQPGKKLMFMGDEIAQWAEWNHDGSLDWGALHSPLNEGMRRWVEDLNRLYRTEPQMHELDFDPAGFAWIDADDSEHSVVCFTRSAPSAEDLVLCVYNFTPVPRHGYRIGVPRPGRWLEILNSDSALYGGSGQGNLGGVEAEESTWHGRPHSLTVTLPPLGAVFFKSSA